MGVFADDSWALTNRLTLNLGLRFDHQDGNILSVDEIDAHRNKTGQKIQGIDNVLAWNTWSPRLGLVFQLTSDQKTVLKANYGHYYDGMTMMAFYRMTKSAQPVIVGTSETFMKPDAIAPPRRVQLSLRFSY